MSLTLLFNTLLLSDMMFSKKKIAVKLNSWFSAISVELLMPLVNSLHCESYVFHWLLLQEKLKVFYFVSSKKNFNFLSNRINTL